MALTSMKFAFIGAGNIAQAIVGGLTSKNSVPSGDIFVFDVDPGKYKSDIMRRVNCCASLCDAVSGAELVLFALKPHVVGAVAKQIAESCGGFENKTYISVAAGVSSDFICAAMGRKVPVIRTMPNTPLLIGQGAVAVSHNKLVSEKIFRYVCCVFSGMAAVSVLDESLMNAVISANGSSPAYVYLFYKAMLDGALAQGIPEEKARPLILQSIKGAVAMIERSDKDADKLIQEVSSPGGTTIAALSVLKGARFSEAVGEAMEACTKRALEMAAEVESSL